MTRDEIEKFLKEATIEFTDLGEITKPDGWSQKARFIIRKLLDKLKVSDGYHTFDELYDHRCHLFVALMRSHPEISWRANNHEDGTMFEGWFVAGMRLPTGDISYHLPNRMWSMLDGCGIGTSLKSPPFDGHTSQDVIARLSAWCEGKP